MAIAISLSVTVSMGLLIIGTFSRMFRVKGELTSTSDGSTSL
jgi:hypothetical protein